MPIQQPTLWETIKEISTSILPVCSIVVTFFAVLWNSRENKKARREEAKEAATAEIEREKKLWAEGMTESVQKLNEGMKMNTLVLEKMNTSLMDKIAATDKKVDNVIADLKDFRNTHRTDINKLHERVDKAEEKINKR